MEKSLIKNKLSAFSLIETIITLAICCGMLLIGSLQLKQYQNSLIFDNTVKEVTASLDQASRVSTIKGCAVIVMFSQDQHYLRLYGDGYDKHINIDPEIKITGLKRFRFSSSGRSTPASVSFRGYGMEKKVKYQMLWGRMAG